MCVSRLAVTCSLTISSICSSTAFSTTKKRQVRQVSFWLYEETVQLCVLRSCSTFACNSFTRKAEHVHKKSKTSFRGPTPHHVNLPPMSCAFDPATSRLLRD
jgi:hypothetical protein